MMGVSGDANGCGNFYVWLCQNGKFCCGVQCNGGSSDVRVRVP